MKMCSSLKFAFVFFSVTLFWPIFFLELPGEKSVNIFEEYKETEDDSLQIVFFWRRTNEIEGL